jgi:hypothetical protein
MFGIVAIGYVGWTTLLSNTKKYSPEASALYEQNGTSLAITYCQPSKKGREIFGGLVPYDVVWRTGANEATIFSSNKTLVMPDGQRLPAGKYSLFSIPRSNGKWVIIFNKEIGQWGTQYSEDNDALRIEAAATELPVVSEVFTARFVDLEGKIQMLLEWDKTQVQLSMQAE